MPKPKGGRGHKAPYQVQMVRCPVPVKPQVEALIAAYREQVLADEVELRQIPMELNSKTELESALKLVNDFVSEIGQSDHLHDRTRRNNVNLARFRDWLENKVKN